MQIAKTLLRLDGCPGRSKSSLGAQVILLVLLCCGSVIELLVLLICFGANEICK